MGLPVGLVSRRYYCPDSVLRGQPRQRVSGRRLVLYGAVENQVVPGLSLTGGSRRPASPSLRLLLPLCLHGLPLAPALLCGGIHSPASSMVAGFSGCNFKSLEGLSRFGGELSLALVC